MMPPPPPDSACDACGKTFSRDPWRPNRNVCCEICGAGKHWECRSTGNVRSRIVGLPSGGSHPRADANRVCWYRTNGKAHKRGDWLIQDEGWQFGPDEIAAAVEDGMGFLDVDGSFVSAGELHAGSNHGRSRSDSHRHHEHGERRVERWANRDPEVVAFLVDCGWMAENAGTTGNPVGRRPRGIRGADLIRQQIERIAQGFDYSTATQAVRASLVVRLLDSEQPVNRQALADYFGVDKSTVTRLYQLGLHQNSPNSEGENFFAA